MVATGELCCLSDNSGSDDLSDFLWTSVLTAKNVHRYIFTLPVFSAIVITRKVLTFILQWNRSRDIWAGGCSECCLVMYFLDKIGHFLWRQQSKEPQGSLCPSVCTSICHTLLNWRHMRSAEKLVIKYKYKYLHITKFTHGSSVFLNIMSNKKVEFNP